MCDDVLTAKEAAALLRAGRTTVYEMFEAGQLEGYRLGVAGKGLRIYRRSVERYKNDQSNRRRAMKPAARKPALPNHRSKQVAPLPPPQIGGYGHGL
jgi:excisionase family DNA binding protein